MTISFRNHQRGIGLIELMISMLIGLFVMAGVVQMVGTSSQNAIATAGSSRIQENIRYVFSRIADDLSMSGNLGCFSASTADRFGGINPDNTKFNVVNMLGIDGTAIVPNTAFDFSNQINGQSITNNSGAAARGTDTFRVRFFDHSVAIAVTDISSSGTEITVDASDSQYDLLRQWQVVGLSNCDLGRMFMITNTPENDGRLLFSGTAAPSGLYNAITNLCAEQDSRASDGCEQINPSNNSDDVGTPFRLYAGRTGAYEYYIGDRQGAGDNSCDPSDNATFGDCSLYVDDGNNPQELVQGVHDMEVNYGVTDPAGNLRFYDAAQLDVGQTVNGELINWQDVDRFVVTLSFNSIDNAIGEGNNLDSVLPKTVSRVFNLYNQL